MAIGMRMHSWEDEPPVNISELMDARRKAETENGKLKDSLELCQELLLLQCQTSDKIHPQVLKYINEKDPLWNKNNSIIAFIESVQEVINKNFETLINKFQKGE